VRPSGANASGAWWPGLGAFILGLLLRNPVVVAAALLFLTIAGASEVWVRHGLGGLAYHRRLSTTRVFPGERFEVEFIVENRKRLPLPRLVVEDDFPAGLELQGVPVTSHHQAGRVRVSNLFALRWWQRVRRTAAAVAGGRGVYRFGPALVVCGDPLGLAQTEMTVEGPAGGTEALIVYPQLIPVTRWPATARALPSGRRARPRVGLADPYDFFGLREYVPGDPLKYLDWKATARTGRLHTRILHPLPSDRAWVVVDISTAAHPYLGTDRDIAETVISMAASLALELLRAGQQVGVLANAYARDWGPALRVAPSSAPAQAALILEGLARLDVFPSTALDDLIRRELPASAADHHLWFVGWSDAPGLGRALDHARARGFRATWIQIEQKEGGAVEPIMAQSGVGGRA
jgi:uncharacterized protein (DUF58 family)